MSRTLVFLCSSSSTINTDHLRSQIDQLQSEAQITRRKANNARFRLLRLSEVAENLCRQAAVSVQKGKEDYARELLLQKKKIKFALEKSKGRVELLDELATKLNEAISVKEAQLVRLVASDLEVDGNDAEGPVRIVYPTKGNEKTLNDDNINALNQCDTGEDQEVVLDIDSEGGMLSYSEAEEAVSERFSNRNEATTFSSIGGPSSFTDFLKELDQQLDFIEKDLINVFELPAMALQNKEKPNDSNLQQLKILENICSARVRISKYVQEVSGTRLLVKVSR